MTDPRVRALQATEAAVAIRERMELRKVSRSAPEVFPEEYWAHIAESLAWSGIARCGVSGVIHTSPIPGRPQPIPPQLRLDPAAGPGPQRARRQSMPAGQIVEHRPINEETNQ